MSDVGSQVTEAFRSRWGVDPDRVLLSPGRINLIGDHTDYSLLPVLPMAIQYGISFAVGPGEPGVVIDSLNEPAELTLRSGNTGLTSTSEGSASWHRYVEIALRYIWSGTYSGSGVRSEVGTDTGPGVRIVLSGDLPSTGGLSSSSALVVGLLAAVTADRSEPLAGQQLVDATVAAERMAAIEGGAMDQTIIVFGVEGAAVRLEFDPPSRRVVPVPDGLSWVAAYSGNQAAKGASAKDAYNTRVVACRASAALLTRAMGLADPPDPLVLGRLGSIPAEALDELPEAATAREVADRTDVPVDLLVAMAAGNFDADLTVPLRDVARHVVDEAAAVDAMERAMAAGDLPEVGRLLTSSHRSLGRFGSTTPALDDLAAATVAAGALGARVTGAGFGGYAIVGCETDRVSTVIDAAVAATGGPAFEVRPSAGLA